MASSAIPIPASAVASSSTSVSAKTRQALKLWPQEWPASGTQ
jgi:hypothetical protein